MGGLTIIDIQTQCETIQSSILVDFIKDKNQKKSWTDLILWFLDQYKKVKQRVSIFKTYKGNMEPLFCLPTYRTFWSSWSSLTGNEIPATKTLAPIHNEPIFFNI